MERKLHGMMADERPQKTATANDQAIDDDEEKVALKKQMSLLVCITVIIGGTIGTGIFISPKGVLQYSESVGLALLVWALTGVIAILAGLSYAELGSTFGKSGGDYTYVNEAFGPLLAFLVAWTQGFISGPASAAVLSITFGRYVAQPLFSECDPPDSSMIMIAVATAVFLYFVNARSVKAATSVQNIFTAAKVIGLSIIIIAGIVQLAKGETQYLENAFEGSTTSIMNVSLAFYQAFFAYGGWVHLNMLTEELMNPQRDFPIAVILSEIAIIVLYVTANIAYLTVMSAEELLASNAVGVTFADYLFGSFAWIIPIFVATSIFGALNGQILSYSRINFTCARDGYLPATMSMVHIDYRTPLPALLTSTVATLLVVAVSTVAGSGIANLLNYISFGNWFSNEMVVAALLYLRWKKPELHRPFKVPLFVPISFVIIAGYLIVTGMIAAPVDTGIGLAIILTGVPVYLFGQWKNKPSSFHDVTDGVSHFIQKFFLVVRQEKETY